MRFYQQYSYGISVINQDSNTTLSFGMNNFLYFCSANPEERFELIATSLKNAKAVFLL